MLALPRCMPDLPVSLMDAPADAGSEHVVFLAEDGSGADLQHVGRLPVLHARWLGIVALVRESRLRMLTVMVRNGNLGLILILRYESIRKKFSSGEAIGVLNVLMHE